MTNPMTKYIAAAGLAGALAFGGFTVASAQDGGSTTTTQPGATTEAPVAPGPNGATPGGDMQGGCNHDKGAAGGGTESTPSQTPGETPSTSSGTANNTST